MSQPQVICYCDGSADAEGHGGAAAIYISQKTGKRREVGVSVREGATNQRMEILAAILALKYLQWAPVSVKIISDSKYVVDCFRQDWIPNWRRKGWRAASAKPVANRDLWETLESLVAIHDVEFEWVKGHAGDVENERVDMLAGAYRYRAHQEEVQATAQATARDYRMGRRSVARDGKGATQKRKRGRRTRSKG